ncbi:WD40 repeat-like protein [Neocallimastix californiae]|uniref:WD40 repeat-like protein n=1 Tax=Neocallimastix californiae TaxID=1754190 RepID=A0A1Y2CB34_9FUNG|nr:WD40 repeat-like protein [Neocallimastix californiae]|eukprot:ORY44261.1 WD40 repeat-like protein [Neocallimastix californiae]
MELHRCRFVNYVPSAINCLALTPNTYKPYTLLACGRENGDIDIWDPKEGWFLKKTIPGGSNQSVETVVWSHQNVITEDDDENLSQKEREKLLKQQLLQEPRLFISGLNGLITEYDIHTLLPKNEVSSNGGPVWCAAVNHKGTVLAVGCEDGCIRLFDIADGNLEYMRSLDRQDGRILSLTWSYDDNSIISGSSVSIIHCLDVKSGQISRRITVDKIRGEDTLVWALEALNKMGTLIKGYKEVHKADVLCLTSTEDGAYVFSSGVDRKIVRFSTVTNTNQKGRKSKEQWVVAGERRYHSHDVRSLIVCEQYNTLLSGGVDTTVVTCELNSFPFGKVIHLQSFPSKPLIQLSKSKKLMMCQLNNTIELWKLGDSTQLEFEKMNKKLLALNLKNDNNIISSTISQNGSWIAVSTIEEIKLFHIKYNEKSTKVEINKVREIEKLQIPGAHKLLFTPCSTKLIVAGINSIIYVLDLSNVEKKYSDNKMENDDAVEEDENEYDIILLKEFEQHNNGTSDCTICSLAISSDSQWLASGDTNNNIYVFNLDTLLYHSKLPTFSSFHTSVSFHPLSATIVVTCLSNEFFIYDVEEKGFANWTKEYLNKLPEAFLKLNEKSKIMGVSFNISEPNTMTLWSSEYICQIDLSKPINVQTTNRKLNTEDNEKNEFKKLKQNYHFSVVTRYKQVMFMDYVNENESVIVERPWFSILEKLPQNFYRHKYGT